MVLRTLELFNFRNYEHLDIEFSPHRNLAIGRNAQGKSNLLESIYFLSYLRSKRARTLADLVREGHEEASVLGSIIGDGSEARVRLTVGARGRTAEVNGQKVGSSARVRGRMKCVSFDPDDLCLVKGEPGRKSGFLDETLEALGPMGAVAINQYGHALRQRNAILKVWERYGTGLEDAIGPWSRGLATYGAKMVASRLEMLRTMEEVVERLYREISQDEKKVELRYAGTFGLEDASEGEIFENMQRALDSVLVEEKRERATRVGPHRDDVEIRLGGRDARYKASQAELRTLAFCMRLAQKEHVERKTGQTPVILFDDVLSELDEGRRRRVLDLAGGESQAMLTATEATADMKRASDKTLVVDGGMISIG